MESFHKTNRIKIYVGCSLTLAPEEFKVAIEQLKQSLREDYEILEFVGLVNGTPKDVFEWDTKCVMDCDLFVADVSHPSIGLGYELGIALSNNKPIIAVAHRDAKVSRLVQGVTHPDYSFHRYDEIKEVTALVKRAVAELESYKM